MAETPAGDDVAAVQKCEQAYNKIRDELSKTIVGQDDVVEQTLVAMFARGHALLEGVPGLAKTLLVSSLAKALHLTFKRVQFTPDLMPSDVTGTDVIQENLETRARQYTFLPGPLFANMVLADEINRTPPKTQAAMLEAMQERQVTIEGETLRLPRPFLVLATQNPVEQEGVYLLPEAQIDRFLIRIRLDYPTAANEMQMLRTYDRAPPPTQPVSSIDELLRLAALVEDVHVEDRVLSYALRLVRATREHGRVALGASPRASLGLVRLAKARALLSGRDYATPDDLIALLPYVLEHRVMVTTDAAIEGATAGHVLSDVLRRTPVVDAKASDRPLPIAPGWADIDA